MIAYAQPAAAGGSSRSIFEFQRTLRAGCFYNSSSGYLWSTMQDHSYGPLDQVTVDTAGNGALPNYEARNLGVPIKAGDTLKTITQTFRTNSGSIADVRFLFAYIEANDKNPLAGFAQDTEITATILHNDLWVNPEDPAQLVLPNSAGYFATRTFEIDFTPQYPGHISAFIRFHEDDYFEPGTSRTVYFDGTQQTFRFETDG